MLKVSVLCNLARMWDLIVRVKDLAYLRAVYRSSTDLWLTCGVQFFHEHNISCVCKVYHQS